jgi:hypothetical protein
VTNFIPPPPLSDPLPTSVLPALPHPLSLSLSLALQFTPQYGDSFIEWLRLCLLVAAGFGTHDDTSSGDENAMMGCGSPDPDAALPRERDRRSLSDVRAMNVDKLLGKVNTKKVERR